MSTRKPKNELLAAIEEGVEAFRTKRELRTHRVRIHEPPRYSARQIHTIRVKTLSASQAVFAQYIGVSPSTIRAWEQAQRTPSLSARRLIQVAARKPEVLRELALSVG